MYEFPTMAIPKTSSKSTPERVFYQNRKKIMSSAVEDQHSSQPLIPGLPNDVAELCLLRLPYPYQALVRSVSYTWNKAISDPSFLLSKKSLSLSLPYLFVLAFEKSTGRLQWQALNTRSGRWFVLPPMPSPKPVCPPGFACVSLPRQGKLIVLGGMRTDTETSMQNTIIYHTSTNQWSLGAQMPTPRSFFEARNINGQIIAVGGSGTTNSDSITAVECYDPEKDAWRSVPKLPVSLARYESAVVGNKLYVTEGWTWPFMFSPKGVVYEPETDRWHEMRSGMREGWTGISVVLRDRLLVISEYGDCPIKVYDPDEDTWKYVGGDRFPCDALKRPFTAVGLEGMIYLVACGLYLGIGKLYEADGNLKVEWEVMPAPSAFQDYAPSSCQLLYT